MLQVSIPIAHELLAQCIKQGQALVQRASLVGDFSDYESWKSARKQWIDPTVQALEHMYGAPREAREFADAVSCPEGAKRWQEQYAADLKCVEGAIDFLTVLQGELAFEGSGRPATEAAGELMAQNGGSAPETALAADERPTPAIEVPQPGETSERGEAAREHDRGPEREHERELGAELATAQRFGAELAPQADVAAPGEREPASTPAQSPMREVLVTHGRDERWKQAVEHLLEQTGQHEIRIVKQRASERGRLVELLGEHASEGRYAVVLLTADDVGGARLESEEEPYFTTRAHQQVVFEMGFLVAALSPGHVCVLYEDGVELPCDLDGVSHVRLDLAGTWQPKLLLHLRRAGFDYDLNRLVAA
ncbi:MAG TPA: TIR domain-containing protein [Solirubrobacteraceae bacterium]|jgi:predicted nucleotide-binding protein|nr:TIR domain-containing protein [Solirubrobacteraceae bacterium]